MKCAQTTRALLVFFVFSVLIGLNIPVSFFVNKYVGSPYKEQYQYYPLVVYLSRYGWKCISNSSETTLMENGYQTITIEKKIRSYWIDPVGK